MNALFRQMTMLRLIPRGRKVTAREVQRALSDEGFSVSLRTVQRDLKEIEEAGLFALESDTRSKPHGWRWNALAVYDIPGMTPSLALAFVLARRYLLDSFPPGVLEHLAAHFKRAEELLKEHPSASLRRWPEKIAILPRQQRLLPARVDQGIHDALAQALMNEKQVEALYQPRDREARSYTLNPLGLVMRGSSTYLVASVKDYDDPMQFALHRFRCVEILPRPSRTPPDFHLATYLHSQAFDYPVQEQAIRLVALFTPGAAHHLHETPLSEDQQMTNHADGRERLTATVKDTQELRWWLQGFADEVEVCEPLELRLAFATTAHRLASRYECPTQDAAQGLSDF